MLKLWRNQEINHDPYIMQANVPTFKNRYEKFVSAAKISQIACYEF